MNRFVFALVLFVLVGCGTASRPQSDGGVPFDRDAEPTRYCLTVDDCYEGEECVEIRLPPTSVCRPGSSTDAGSNPPVDATLDAGVGSDASAPSEDAGVSSSCWASRNLNVNWTLVSIVSTGTTSCTAPSSMSPTALVTTMRAPCTLGVGSTWSDGTTVNDNECERQGTTTSCAADLVYPAVLEGAALYRMPVVGDTVTMTYESCRATFRAQIVIEGAAW